jgi:hypothetical protein
MIASQYFGYSHGYYVASSIDPGKGYWIKSHSLGTLTLTASSIPKVTTGATDLSTLNRITVGDASRYQQSLYLANENAVKGGSSMYELPPPAPEGTFDARFGTQRMLETYPATMERGKVYEYPVTIQTNSYPVTVEWQIQNTDGHTLLLTDGQGGRVLNNVVLNGKGSLKITNPSVKSVVIRMADGISIPKTFALSQNYPNPFNPTTRFDVDVAKTTTVEVVVYDILGEKVATLLSGLQSAGYHTVQWDGRDTHGLLSPSGMYFVRMTADQFTSVRKIMLLK